MSSRFRQAERFAALAALASIAAYGASPDQPPASESPPLSVAVTTLFPGGGSPPPPDPHVKLYEGNPKQIAEGRRLFDWYNCSGCHFYGAGGIGPSLMDPEWLYGDRLDQIFASIYQGRPNGMPSWAGKIPDEQIWQIAAYVKSLSSSAAETSPLPTKPPEVGEPLPSETSTVSGVPK
ncbi:MAG TPA: cytochrome c [Alphaproteobacteria bacterium]|nr:cytochrome c [Alphaproteobacteria bacterium]